MLLCVISSRRLRSQSQGEPLKVLIPSPTFHLHAAHTLKNTSLVSKEEVNNWNHFGNNGKCDDKKKKKTAVLARMIQVSRFQTS